MLLSPPYSSEICCVVAFLQRALLLFYNVLCCFSTTCFLLFISTWHLDINLPLSGPGLFSRSPGPRGDSETQTPKIKVNINQLKLCMSNYIYNSIPDAKFERDSSSTFGDMTSQNFPRKKGTSHQIRLFTPGKVQVYM